MPQRFGIYRRAFGDIIVESSFDFDTQSIGPYTIPDALPYSYDYVGYILPKHEIYSQLLKYRNALAVVDVNGKFFGIIERDKYYLVDGSDKSICKTKEFSIPMNVPEYRHIGYRKTYPKNLSVYHYPWYLLQNVATGEVLDFEDTVVNSPLVEPHVGLYKNLVDTSYEAVYFDTTRNCISYLEKGE